MTAYTTAGTNNVKNWTDTSAWSPTGYPVAGDDVTINGNNIITLVSNSACKDVTINGGSLVMNSYALTLDDSTGAFLFIAGITAFTNFQANWGSIIQSASANPNYPWRFIIQNCTPEVRGIALDGVNLINNAPLLCLDSTSVFCFNSSPGTTGYMGAFLTDFGTKNAKVNMITHQIPGRVRDRPHWNGTTGGKITIKGYVPCSAQMSARLEYFKQTPGPWAYTGHWSHISRGRITDVRQSVKPGSLYIQFEIDIVEDL